MSSPAPLLAAPEPLVSDQAAGLLLASGLFAMPTVTIPAAASQQAVAAIDALEPLMGSARWAASVLPDLPDLPAAAALGGQDAVLMGYDFHLTPVGPRLIEINTNAGGCLLGGWWYQQAPNPCRVTAPLATQLGPTLVAMIHSAFAAEKPGHRLDYLVILDDNPAGQFLYQEFLGMAELLTRAGIKTAIVAPSELQWLNGRLWHQKNSVDMIYNRHTDFYLNDPALGAIRAALAAGAVVVNPAPRAHALRANKAHLLRLTDPQLLSDCGLDAGQQAAIGAVVAAARPVRPDSADALWAERGRWFFKPLAGHGGKAVYRGDKLTRGVWAMIQQGGYIAQQYVPPPTITVCDQTYKWDWRIYTWRGAPLLTLARLYQGQTTNFRTQGGGFARVQII